MVTCSSRCFLCTVTWQLSLVQGTSLKRQDAKWTCFTKKICDSAASVYFKTRASQFQNIRVSETFLKCQSRRLAMVLMKSLILSKYVPRLFFSFTVIRFAAFFYHYMWYVNNLIEVAKINGWVPKDRLGTSIGLSTSCLQMFEELLQFSLKVAQKLPENPNVAQQLLFSILAWRG